jgi:hypothetical protein
MDEREEHMRSVFGQCGITKDDEMNFLCGQFKSVADMAADSSGRLKKYAPVVSGIGVAMHAYRIGAVAAAAAGGTVALGPVIIAGLAGYGVMKVMTTMLSAQQKSYIRDLAKSGSQPGRYTDQGWQFDAQD